MKNETDIKIVMEKIKINLTKETDPHAIAALQGQYQALEYVLDDQEEKEE